MASGGFKSPPPSALSTPPPATKEKPPCKQRPIYLQLLGLPDRQRSTHVDGVWGVAPLATRQPCAALDNGLEATLDARHELVGRVFEDLPRRSGRRWDGGLAVLLEWEFP
jgi:hypothetical protein